MAPVFAVAEAVFSAVLVVAVARYLLKRQAGRFWWVAFCFAALLGLSVGVCFGFFFDYQPSSGIVVYSFPVPGAFRIFETYESGESQWTYFITPAPLLSALANSILFIGLGIIPIWIAHAALARRGQSAATQPP